MHQYVHDVKDAAERLIGGIFFEEEHIETLKAKLEQIEVNVKDAVDKAEFLTLNPDLDDEGLGTLNRWEAHFGGAELVRTEDDIRDLESAIANRSLSINALSMSLLQLAKQGISKEFGRSRNSCPNEGRHIGSQPLRNVIWEGRNQAIHFEDGSFSANVTACFTQLEQDFGSQFSLSQHSQSSLAFNVVNLLGWNTFKSFSDDLDSLLMTR